MVGRAPIAAGAGGERPGGDAGEASSTSDAGGASSAGGAGGASGTSDAGEASDAGGASSAGGAGGEPGTAECETGAKQCVGNAAQACVARAWAKPVACASPTPVCEGAGVCGTPPSCRGLADTCGAAADAACCSSSVIPGGTFDRSNDASYPATVSDFRLDTYEVTVGRYRKLVAAYSRDMVPNGAGKNPNNASDPGWDATWNAQMSADAAALATALKCNGTTWTDTASSNENLPATCMNWYEANAFCIWDGGNRARAASGPAQAVGVHAAAHTAGSVGL